ncbi:hypothetical protein B0H16DRAFT_863291 [Mycena metata]|uniref:Thioesterase domain-containing protein n=1 Tax=Mycena metata TaxID=1033252 RepID=A0AAD7IUW9_9AGAR|nr:hypothetical protein B0H16DRAFT_863291 [Mycena metata]
MHLLDWELSTNPKIFCRDMNLGSNVIQPHQQPRSSWTSCVNGQQEVAGQELCKRLRLSLLFTTRLSPCAALRAYIQARHFYSAPKRARAGMNSHLLSSTTTSMTAPWETFQRSLPQASNVDVRQIRGNISDAEKQINANVLAYFTTGSGVSPFPPFGSEIAGRLRIVELNVWDNASTGSAESEVVLEIEVTESMCNVYGTMHGGCAAFILDPCTVSATVLLGLAKAFDGTGVSQSMNVYWHHAALLGSTLTVTTRSVFTDGRARVARCEIREKLTGSLIVSGTHSFLNAGRATKL